MAKFMLHQSSFFVSFITLIVSSGAGTRLGHQVEQRNGNETVIKEGRILGGMPAIAGQFPYLVYIISTLPGTNTLSCGGTLLSETFVVTAAQCVVASSSIKVVGGVLDPAATTGQTSYGIAMIHPGYRKNLQINDIALVRLLSPFILGPYVFPIKLPKKFNPRLDMISLTLAGWGPADGSKTILSTVNFVELRQLTKKDCLSATKEIFVSYPAMTACLDTEGRSKGFCYGDSGGPVTYTFPDEIDPSLVGVLSQYQFCPDSYPMSYTKIAPFSRWIKNAVKRLLA